MNNIMENDICINFGFIQECENCNDMCNFNCKEYESKNTRQLEINKLYSKEME